jgi:hypothetical protein
MNRYVTFVILFMLASCFSSCSFYRLMTHKKAKGHDKTIVKAGVDTTKVAAAAPEIKTPIKDSTVATPDTSVTTRQLIEQLTPIWKNRLVYKTFSGKAKMHFTGPEDKQEFTAHIRLRKDSVMWINVTAALGGISVARILITPDSFFMINFLGKEVTRMALSNATKILPTKVDFSSLQNIVVGEPLRDGTITDARNFGGDWTIFVEDSSYLQRIVYNKSDSTMRTSQLRTRDPNGPQAMAEYGSYLITNNGKISTGRVLNIQNGNDMYSLDMNFSRIDFDQPLDFPFYIPENYTLKQ